MTDVKERPILFSGPMVRAILEGRKTQTRRIVLHKHLYKVFNAGATQDEMRDLRNRPVFLRGSPTKGGSFLGELATHCPYGKAGDRLWVRETLRRVQDCEGCMPLTVFDIDRTPVRDHFGDHEWTWKPSFLPSIHMPRWASRLMLEITGVRVERLQDITEEDAMDEGIEFHGDQPGPRDEFSGLWESINAKRGYPWESNPWVWVVEFKRIGPTLQNSVADRR